MGLAGRTLSLWTIKLGIGMVWLAVAIAAAAWMWVQTEWTGPLVVGLLVVPGAWALGLGMVADRKFVKQVRREISYEQSRRRAEAVTALIPRVRTEPDAKRFQTGRAR